MTARTVVGTLEFPVGSGTPCVGARISATLNANGEIAYGAAGDRPVGAVAALTDNNGRWALDLEPNANITPAGTVWQITEAPPDRPTSSYYIEVPDSPGPHEATTVLAELPGALPSQALVAHTALLHAHGVATWRNIDDLGAVAGMPSAAATNRVAFQEAFDSASADGFGIFIPPKTYHIDPSIFVRHNARVWCLGTLVCASEGDGLGGFVHIDDDDNVSWYGGTIDGGGAGGVAGTNGLAIGGRVEPGAAEAGSNRDAMLNTTVHGVRIINCRSAGSKFASGGKGFTCQFHVDGVLLSDIIVEQCDIPFSVETALTNRVAHGVSMVNVLCRDCTSGPFFGAIRPEGVGSLDDHGYLEATFGQTTIRNLTIDNCGNGDDPGNGYGVFNSNYMVHLDMEATVLVESDRVTLWRGNVAHSRIKINAAVDNLYDAVDLRGYQEATQAGATSAGNDFDVTVRVADSIAGVLYRGDGAKTARSTVAVAFYHDTAPTLAANLTGHAAVRYRFFDIREGRSVEGSAVNAATPTFGSAAAVFNDNDTAFNGSVRIGPNSGATAYLTPMWLNGFALWVDSTGDLRIKGSAPASDTDGSVVGAQS